MTGLGPSGNDNDTLGGLYFNGTKIPHGKQRAKSQYIISKLGTQTAGVFNIKRCKAFSTNVEGSINAEGVYTCIMKNSSMVYESIRFGVYFSGRSELFDIQYVFRHLDILHLSTQLLL